MVFILSLLINTNGNKRLFQAETKLKIDVKPTVASPLVNGYRNKAIVAFNQK